MFTQGKGNAYNALTTEASFFFRGNWRGRSPYRTFIKSNKRTESLQAEFKKQKRRKKMRQNPGLRSFLTIVSIVQTELKDLI